VGQYVDIFSGIQLSTAARLQEATLSS
jgi:hypothetical protein